jgi:alanyl-tRNA synthetase
MRTTAELREGFLSFFEEKDHQRRPSASVIPPPDDPTTLFIVAGMQPMKRWFLGAEAPPAPRVTTSQKVMRAGGKHNDLDDVGRTARHASFFEMLGNFSFGDYFKDDAIDFAWEFVTERMGFAPERLWATVFASAFLASESSACRARRISGRRPRRARAGRARSSTTTAERSSAAAAPIARPGANTASATSSSGTSSSWSSTSTPTAR